MPLFFRLSVPFFFGLSVPFVPDSPSPLFRERPLLCAWPRFPGRLGVRSRDLSPQRPNRKSAELGGVRAERRVRHSTRRSSGAHAALTRHSGGSRLSCTAALLRARACLACRSVRACVVPSTRTCPPLTRAAALTALFDAGDCTADRQRRRTHSLTHSLTRPPPINPRCARALGTAVRPGAAQTAARGLQADVPLYCL